MYEEKKSILPFDATGNYGPLFVRTAWQCFNTFRKTDYFGGCNGARIRTKPQSTWLANKGIDKAIELLLPVKDKYSSQGLTWADLIVLSGTTALNDAARKASAPTSFSIPFIGGRSDSLSTESESVSPDYLQLRIQGGESDDTSLQVRDVATVLGLTDREFVALVGGGHGLGRMHNIISGFPDNATWTTSPGKLTNEFFVNLQNYDWKKAGHHPHIHYYTNSSGSAWNLRMLKSDMQFIYDPSYQAIVQEYSQNVEDFYSEFSTAWYKIMTADFYGINTDAEPVSSSSDESADSDKSAIGIALGVVLIFFLCIVFYQVKKNRAIANAFAKNVSVNTLDTSNPLRKS
jgi:catalase (peroxidase I)